MSRRRVRRGVGVTLTGAAAIGLASLGIAACGSVNAAHHRKGCPTGQFRGADGQCISFTQETQSVQQYSQNAPTNTTDTAGTTDTTGTTPSVPIPVGQSQVLQATNEGDPINVKVTAVRDLAGDQFNTPASGSHYVGVYYSMTNQGTATYNDSPGNEVTLVLGDNSTVSPDISTLSTCNTPGQVVIGANETRTACVLFEVPLGKQLQSVEVAMDSGFSPSGEWTVTPPTSSKTSSTSTSGRTGPKPTAFACQTAKAEGLTLPGCH